MWKFISQKGNNLKDHVFEKPCAPGEQSEEEKQLEWLQKPFFMKMVQAEARIWPCLACVLQVGSTAEVPQYPPTLRLSRLAGRISEQWLQRHSEAGSSYTLIRKSVHHKYDSPMGMGAIPSERRITAPMPNGSNALGRNRIHDDFLPG